MTIQTLDWEDFQEFLLYDLKLSDTPSNVVSIKSRFFILKRRFDKTPLTRKTFINFLKSMSDYKPAYLNNFIKLAKQISKYYKRGEFEDFTYFREVVEPKEVLTPQEIKKIIYCRRTYPHHSSVKSKKYELALLFLSITGCRVGELISLKKKDLYNEYVIFRNTKNGDSRIVPLPIDLAKRLKALNSKDTVFGIKDRSWFSDEIKTRARLAGITKNVYPHIFRHSFITEMLKYTDSLMVAKLVGHKDVNSTQRYNQTSLDTLRSIQGFHPLLRENATLPSISMKVRAYIEKLVDGGRYTFSHQESTSSLVFRIASLPLKKPKLIM